MGKRAGRTRRGRWPVLIRLSFLGAFAYALAEVLGRGLGWGAWGGNPQAGGKVALTFDDGPSPRTPELLLALGDVRATFFVTQPACRAYPAELEQIRRAGHQIEAHGRWHKPALLLWPWQEWAQVAWHPCPHGRGKLYRPPYGGHSPFTRLFAALQERRVALWDAESRDWTGATASELVQTTLAQVRPGSVVLLHDGPSPTPDLVRKLLPELHERGLQAVTLEELPLGRISWREGLQRLRRSYGQ